MDGQRKRSKERDGQTDRQAARQKTRKKNEGAKVHWWVQSCIGLSLNKPFFGLESGILMASIPLLYNFAAVEKLNKP